MSHARTDAEHDALGHAPVIVRDTRFWMTHHCGKRLNEMKVSASLVATIMEHGRVTIAPRDSKYCGMTRYALGKVAVMVDQDTRSVVTAVWASADAWDEFGVKGTRVARPREVTEEQIRKWDDNELQ